MKIKRSKRGLTFSIREKLFGIGEKYRYIVDKANKEILIIPDKNGNMTVSRKKSGNAYKPLFDIRSKEVREIVCACDYLEVEVRKNKIVVHTIKKVSEKEIIHRSNLVKIQDVIGRCTGEIVLDCAVGSNYPQKLFGRPTLSDDAYFSYLCGSNCEGGTSSGTVSRKARKEIQKVYDVVSLFSGAGLLDYAFKDPQFRFVYGVDFDKDACETYRNNIGNHIMCDDIRNVDAKDVPDADVVIGGPCCQAYSSANRRNEKSEDAEKKRLLIEDYVRIVKCKQPKVFVIENVPQLLTKEHGMYINKVFNSLPEYEITTKVVCDSSVGGYTTRKRAIVIGSRIGEIVLPDVTFQTVKTVRDALKDVDSTWFNWNDVTLPRESTRLTMSYVPQGGNWKDVPPEIHKFGPATHSDIYQRLAWDQPSPTLVNWRKINLTHPEENRILNVSEAAALMGLPKEFKVFGSTLNAKQQQIGNGVTQAIGRFVKKYVLQALNMDGKIVKFA